MAELALKTSQPRRLTPLRLMDCMLGQRRRTTWCPSSPSLRGRLAVVTGGGSGIGYQTARGLAQRGADVVIASRNLDKCQHAADELARETNAQVSAIGLDLANLHQVREAADTLRALLENRLINILVNNAGVWPQRYGTSAQGHEISFAVNVLGHHYLTRELLDGPLRPDARIVALTGDIYTLSNQCTPDYRYRGRIGGQFAYCRSKLGNLWWAQELQRRCPGLSVFAVHPGVVASDLGGTDRATKLMKQTFPTISPELGAQTSLICATQPGLQPGGYYHITLGSVELRASDPGADRAKASQLWDTLEALCEVGLESDHGDAKGLIAASA